MTEFKNGDTVKFKAGPKSTGLTTAKVTGKHGVYLVTTDDAGKERRVRPGACTLA